MLGLENELADRVYPSRRVVNWYNGSLDNDIEDLGLDKVRDAVVIGNGNIFCDIGRVLLKDPKELRKTDIPESVAEQLMASNLTNIQSVARKGITHAAFTTKEIKELSAIPGLERYMMKDEVQRSMTDASEAEMHSTYARAVGRRTEFLLKSFRAIQSDDHLAELLNNGKRKLILRFLMTPTGINLDSQGKFESLDFQRNNL